MTIVAALDFTKVLSGDALAIAGTGLLIVFAALGLITVFIAMLPRVLNVVAAILPVVPDRHVRQDSSESLLADEAVLAAIGFVLHTELTKQSQTHGTAG